MKFSHSKSEKIRISEQVIQVIEEYIETSIPKKLEEDDIIEMQFESVNINCFILFFLFCIIIN